jgi:hypothetical protein
MKMVTLQMFVMLDRWKHFFSNLLVVYVTDKFRGPEILLSQ